MTPKEILTTYGSCKVCKAGWTPGNWIELLRMHNQTEGWGRDDVGDEGPLSGDDWIRLEDAIELQKAAFQERVQEELASLQHEIRTSSNLSEQLEKVKQLHESIEATQWDLQSWIDG